MARAKQKRRKFAQSSPGRPSSGRPSSGRLLRTRGLSVGVFIALTAGANVVPLYAHAPPEVTRILWSAEEDNVVLVANRGLIFGDAERGDWSLMCGAAASVSFEERADYVRLPKGRLLAASTSGLRVTENKGCDWKPVKPFEKLSTLSLAQHPSEPNTLYLSVYGAGQSGIQESRDGGKTWMSRWSLAEGESISELVLAPSQPKRIYGSGSAGAAVHFIARSDDAGGSWEKLPLTLREGEGEARLLAVSPTDPELLLVLALHDERGMEPDRLLVSRDGGESFAELWSDLELFDAAFGVDGELAWVAGSYGLWKSNPALTAVSQVGSAQLMTCVETHGDFLFACGHHSGFDPAGAGVGKSSAAGDSFESWLAFPEIERQIDCPKGSSTASTCEELWQDWKLEILEGLGGLPEDEDDDAPSPNSDAASDDGADIDSAPARGAGSQAKAGGCAATAASSDSPFNARCAVLLAALVGLLRRRRTN